MSCESSSVCFHTHTSAHLAEYCRLHPHCWQDKSHKSLTVIMAQRRHYITWQLVSSFFICQKSEQISISDQVHMLNILGHTCDSVCISSSWLLCSMKASAWGQTVPERRRPTATPAPPPVPNHSTTIPTCSTRNQAEERLKSTRLSSKPVCHIFNKCFLMRLSDKEKSSSMTADFKRFSIPPIFDTKYYISVINLREVSATNT